ncbi:hypothetical protein [Paraburkholderia youngii]|uniref:hypothetical protein n=1 Tax=Paraburkholderia youngii TaxID=2782701 RepID=UPI003D255E24
MTQRVTTNPSAAVYTAFRITNPAKESPADPSKRNVADMSAVITAAATTPITSPKDFAWQMREHAALREDRVAPCEPTGAKLPARRRCDKQGYQQRQHDGRHCDIDDDATVSEERHECHPPIAEPRNSRG